MTTDRPVFRRKRDERVAQEIMKLRATYDTLKDPNQLAAYYLVIKALEWTLIQGIRRPAEELRQRIA